MYVVVVDVSGYFFICKFLDTIQCTSGNHTFAAIRGKESYQLVGALSVVIGEINSLVTSESLAVLPGVKVEVVLGGDYKVHVCSYFVYIPYSLDQIPLSNSHRTSGSTERNSCRSRIVATPRLLFEKHASTSTCLATRSRWQVQEEYLAVL